MQSFGETPLEITKTNAMQMTTDQAATRSIELLNELLAMKSREDGVPRSAIGVIGPKEGYDQLAKDVQEIAMFVFAAQKAIPLMLRLAEAGRTLEARGAIQVDHHESFALKALDHFQASIATP